MTRILGYYSTVVAQTHLDWKPFSLLDFGGFGEYNSFKEHLRRGHMDITYKTATASEIESIFQQSKQLIDTYEDVNAIDYDMVLDWMRRKITKKIDEYQVIYADGKKAGYYRFCRNQDGVLEIDDLYIFPDFQSKGIGTKVFQRCCDGTTEPIMFYVFSRNTRAIALYKRLGFSIHEKVGNTRYIMRKE